MSTSIGLAGPLTLRVDRLRLVELCKTRGWVKQEEIAEGLQIQQATVSRLLRGHTAPGPIVIAHLRREFPDEWTTVLETVINQERAAA